MQKPTNFTGTIAKQNEYLGRATCDHWKQKFWKNGKTCHMNIADFLNFCSKLLTLHSQKHMHFHVNFDTFMTNIDRSNTASQIRHSPGSMDLWQSQERRLKSNRQNEVKPRKTR